MKSLPSCKVIGVFVCFFFLQAEDGLRELVRSRGLGDVYKRQGLESIGNAVDSVVDGIAGFLFGGLGHTSSPAIHYEQNATAARTIPAAPEAQPSQARQVREEGKRAETGLSLIPI